MVKRRTKLAKTPLSELRTSKKNAKNSRVAKLTGELDLKKEKDFRKFIRTIRSYNEGEYWKALIDLAASSPRKVMKGQVVIFVDKFKHPEQKKSPAHIAYGLILVSNKIPKKWQRVIINHEIDEVILRYAGYSFLKPRVDHYIARRREKQNLERKGELIPFMRWLKRNYPLVFETRLKVWKIPRESIK